jgi:hypothetical protein
MRSFVGVGGHGLRVARSRAVSGDGKPASHLLDTVHRGHVSSASPCRFCLKKIQWSVPIDKCATRSPGERTRDAIPLVKGGEEHPKLPHFPESVRKIVPFSLGEHSGLLPASWISAASGCCFLRRSIAERRPDLREGKLRTLLDRENIVH